MGSVKNYAFKNQYVADFETIHIDTQYFLKHEDVEVVYWYAKHINEDKDIGGNEFEGIYSNSFYLWLLSLTQNTTIWFHNLSWDGEFIIAMLLKHGWTMNYGSSAETENGTEIYLNQAYYLTGKDKIKLKSRHFDVFMNGNKIYEIIMHYKNGRANKDIYIQFRCSLRLLTTSIKLLSKSYYHINFLGKPLKKLFEDEEQMGNDFYVREPEDSLEAFKAKNADFVDYCKRDVEIARLALLDFNKTINELPSVLAYQKYYVLPKLRKKNPLAKQTEYNSFAKSLTIGGLGRQLMKSIYIPKFQKTDPKYYSSYVPYNDRIGNMIFVNKQVHQFIKNNDNNFYIGAFTQFNPKYQLDHQTKHLKNGIKIDVVSAYPYQMTKPLPYGELYDNDTFEKIKQPDWKQGIDYIEFLTIKVGKLTPNEFNNDCAVIRNYSNFTDEQLKLKYRYVNKIQRDITLCLIRDEFEELKHWAKFEELEITKHYMLAAPFLRDYATEVIAMKTKYGKENKAAFKQSTKILANAAYGSLGMRMDYDALIQFETEAYKQLIMDADYLITDNKFNKNKMGRLVGKSLSKSIGDLSAIRFRLENDKTRFFNVAAAATITALQRIYILQTIRDIGPQYFAYSDTDSIILVNYDEAARVKINNIVGSNLGQWEIEADNLTGFGARKAKDYYVVREGGKIEYKAAGFTYKEKIQELIYQFHYENLDEYLNKDLVVKNATLKALKCKSGLVLINIDKINNFGVT